MSNDGPGSLGALYESSARRHVPQMPSRQSESNATGSSPAALSCSLRTSSISRKLMSGEMSATW